MGVTGEDVEEDLYNALRLTMKALKEKGGLDPGRYRGTIKLAGELMGHALAATLHSTCLEELLDELASKWQGASLGRMEVVSTEPLILEIRDCYDCLGVKYGVGETLCPYKEGLLKAVLQDRLGVGSKVVEVECCGTFAEHCRFRVEMARAT